MYLFKLHIIDYGNISYSATQQPKQGRAEQSNKSELIWILSILGTLVLCTILFISIVIYRRKSKFIYELFLQPDYFTVQFYLIIIYILMIRKTWIKSIEFRAVFDIDMHILLAVLAPKSWSWIYIHVHNKHFHPFSVLKNKLIIQ